MNFLSDLKNLPLPHLRRPLRCWPCRPPPRRRRQVRRHQPQPTFEISFELTGEVRRLNKIEVHFLVL